ncbi:MAG: hypothetical protein M0R76_13600 [Proteobacteria bacterium]|nr:hypothetical protein [Pseudomonadota bacterium]
MTLPGFLSPAFTGRAFHAAPGFLHHLKTELNSGDLFEAGDLLVAPHSQQTPFWTRNTWLDPFVATFDSISQAANMLRAIQRNWAPCPVQAHRRTALISDALPPLPKKPRPFPFALPDVPMGAFALLDPHTLLASPTCSSPFPGGEIQFDENHTVPPSRAYLKLWEIFTRLGIHPRPGERCLDAGASPGGWTWVLTQLGADVLAVDRAPLAPHIAASPQVTAWQRNAFTLPPEEVGPVDWLFSDVICYPAALLRWVETWLASGLAARFVCTIKMQGTAFDRETTARFAAIPGSHIVHLWHNKHELTWYRL